MKNFCPNTSGSTEITEINGIEVESGSNRARTGQCNVAPDNANRRGWVFYDGECRHCIAAAKRFQKTFGRRGFEFLPLQTSWVQQRLGLDRNVPLQEMRVLTANGRDFGGANAVIFLASQIWWAKPFALLAWLPGFRSLADKAYRWIAAHRHCSRSTCPTPVGRDRFLPTGIGPWLGLALPILALFARNLVPAWGFMWLMAGAIFFGCKWIMLCRALSHSPNFRLGRAAGYLFFWAGMDPTPFVASKPTEEKQAIREAIIALGQIAIGMTLLFVVAKSAPHPLASGWIGMTGLILILHFGLFDLAAVAWRIAGVDAKPIMNAPIKSTSLTEFWGRRWNGAFNQLVLGIFFRPLSRSIGTIRATLTAFLISGVIHELVISLPAGGGYGLPTSYFLLQGWGVVAQRSPFGKRFGLRRGVRGWLFTMSFTALPAFWLFHPLFVRKVILPFMQFIHAI